ncbi:4'-phosphopantetheinyl transferase superfamily protein [Massilia phyllosphaerae]|uniref:4'-phosphopantetheinyl transferase superfamily protein n=1 Tax=Massilia phyllosphaerae TaxID=3106034 RepID=UPI002B1CC8FE|nr:4'-phosphopantetheinyl transferase superfamily protein [Massilia sp. SGZ-792]
MDEPVTVAWPGDPVLEGPGGVRVIGVPGQPDRETARLRIRAALATALAAHCGIDPDRIGLHSPEGAAPWATAALDGGERRIALAISHDGDISVAVFRADGSAVGIDVSQVVPVPDWEPVARDYLGPAVTAQLAGLPAAVRDAAFAQAWSEHEARLKCLGLQLDEWRAERAPALQACRCFPLALQAGYVGYLALAADGA